MQVPSSRNDTQSILAIARQSAIKQQLREQGGNQTASTAGSASLITSNSLNFSASALQSMLSASALDKSGTGTQFNYSGPNLAAVTTTNNEAISCGLSGGFDLNEILTDEDKIVTGYDPNDPNPNTAAMIIASSRYSGQLNGPITSNFISTIQDFNEVSDAIVQRMQYNLKQLADSSNQT